MKHATPVALDALEPLLAALRGIDGLTERKRGVFYRRSQAALHFHEDPAGFFADVRLGPGWVRLPVNTVHERRSLLAELKAELAATERRVRK
ncbi:MAG TPA: hypothetical protein VFH62_08580 [Dehalococcoidia bacterium]|jgi:hypothetical protein|nr:hypothetical protein [Dehalococcoidia bacterium]